MNKVDLFIPTFNRPEFLKRILNYYNSYNVDYNIFIVDSSNQNNKKINKRNISLYPHLNIKYIDKCSSNMNFHMKFGEMVKYAKSKYCVFCPDDDFIIPNGINKAVEFLEKNPDYAAAHGTYISFYIYKNPFLKKFWWRFFYRNKSIISSDPLERLSYHLTNYNLVLWSVRRTEVVKTCYREFLNSKVNLILFGELLPDMLTIVYGKIKRLNIFYAARQEFSHSYSHWPSLQDSISTGTYDAEYKNFKSCIASNLEKFGTAKKETNEAVDLYMSNYLRYSTQEHLTGRVNLLLKHFPNFVAKTLRLLHAMYLFSKDKNDRIGKINNPSSKYFSDFNNIRQLVLKYDK